MNVLAGTAAIPKRVSMLLALAKPRLNALAVATVGIGYYLGARPPDLYSLLLVLAGSGLVAGGGAVFNQVTERDVDALMARTRARPLPVGGIPPSVASLYAATLSAAGLAVLSVGANLAAATIALATLVSYAWIYTPLKRRSGWAVLVGAVPGALPPVIGWAAARGTLDLEAWLLFAIVFAWQLPHFLALAWLYRDDYARAGMPLLARVDASGRRTAGQSLLWAALLVALCLLTGATDLSSMPFAVGAAAAGSALCLLSARFALKQSDRRARALFRGSLVVLPLIWLALIAGHAAL